MDSKTTIIIKVDHMKTRKRTPPTGGAMVAQKGKGSYRRKDKRNQKLESFDD